MYIKKIIKAEIVWGMICIIDWCTSNFSLIKVFKENVITEKELILNMLSPHTGYESYVKCIMIYTLFFLLFYEYLGLESSSHIIIRRKSRINYCKNKVWRITQIAFLFSGMHEFVNLCGMLNVFTLSKILDFHVIYAEIFQLESLTLFFLQVGVVFEIIRTYHGKTVSVIYCFIIYAVQYYVFVLFQPVWLPMYDVLYMDQIVTKRINIVEIIASLGRGTALIYILCIIFSYIFVRKDIYD